VLFDCGYGGVKERDGEGFSGAAYLLQKWRCKRNCTRVQLEESKIRRRTSNGSVVPRGKLLLAKLRLLIFSGGERAKKVLLFNFGSSFVELVAKN
jgi:hypothetical protein